MEGRLWTEQLLTEGKDILDIVDITGFKIKKIKEYEANWKANKNKQEIIDIVRDDENNLEQAMTIFQDKLGEKESNTIGEAVEAAKGLKVLDTEIQQTCSLALKRANKFLSEDNVKLSPSQWKTIVDGIASMYSSIFVPQGTNINILNNNGGGNTELGGWKDGLR